MNHILIIGGGGGLGSALVNRLLALDYQVSVAGRTQPKRSEVKHFYPIDAKNIDWQTLYKTIERDSAKSIDALIFVSGTAVFGKTVMIPAERARQTFELNFWACTTAAKAAAEYWSHKKQAGKFMAILSIAARKSIPFEAYYSASKAATARFLECLQLEYSHKNIKFINAFPGLLKTPFRNRVEWYGLKPTFGDEGADIQKSAEVIVNLLRGKRKSTVIGWRERIIDLAERLLPGLYDRLVLRNRVKEMLK